MAISDPQSSLCFRHVGRQFQPSDEDLSSAFAGLLSGFQSPSRIHAFLTQVTVLLVQNRVSTRRAAIFDVPRPDRDDDISPERAMVNRWADRCAPVTTPVEPDGYDGYTSNPEDSK